VILSTVKRGLGLIPKPNLTMLQCSLWSNKSPSEEHSLYLITTMGFAYFDLWNKALSSCTKRKIFQHTMCTK